MANNSLVKELAVNNTVYDVGVKRIQNVDGLNTRLVNIDAAITTTNNNVSEIADTVDVLQSIGRFLSLWDATTGLMVNEPATDEFEYSTGDYFIISKIPNPEEGTTIAFKPKGDTYYKMDVIERRKYVDNCKKEQTFIKNQKLCQKLWDEYHSCNYETFKDFILKEHILSNNAHVRGPLQTPQHPFACLPGFYLEMCQ